MMERDEKKRGPGKWILIGILGTAVLLGAVLAAVLLRKKPAGGEIYSRDLKKGYVQVYVEDPYVEQINTYQGKIIYRDPTEIRSITSEKLKTEVLDILSHLMGRREAAPLDHEAFEEGIATVRHHSRLFILAGSYCYRIEILDGETYSGKYWDHVPILEEFSGNAVALVSRIDLSKHVPSALYDDLSYACHYNGPDSLNSENGRGWYSTFSQKDAAKLLELEESVKAEN